jgi:hypothetical protein
MAALNGDLRCRRQATQVCGVVSKFFGVAGDEQWQNGIPGRRDLGCDGPTNVFTLPPAAASCVAAFFPNHSTAHVNVTVIGTASLSNWCSAADCRLLYPYFGKPVVVCHELGFDASLCCVEPGQLPPSNFTSTVSCMSLAVGTTATIRFNTTDTSALVTTNASVHYFSSDHSITSASDNEPLVVAAAVVGGLVAIAVCVCAFFVSIAARGACLLQPLSRPCKIMAMIRRGIGIPYNMMMYRPCARMLFITKQRRPFNNVILLCNRRRSAILCVSLYLV